MGRCSCRWILLLALSTLLLTQAGSPAFFTISENSTPLPAVIPQEDVPLGFSDEEESPNMGFSSHVDTGPVPEAEGQQITVYSFAELKSALESPDVTEIYLGTDIKTTSGVQISNRKPSLVIDGTNPLDPNGRRHTITQHASLDMGQVFHLDSSGSLMEITVRNLNIDGSNYYGLVAIGDGVRDILLQFEDVDYNGPQMVYNRWGTARFTDCNIQIGKFGRATGLGEVTESRYTEFAGTVDVSQAEGQSNEIIFIDTGTGSIDILPGARVTVSTYTESGFVYSTYPYTMTIHEDAEFVYTAPRRFWENRLMTELTVKEGGSFSVYLTGSIINDMVRVAGNVTVEPDGVLRIIALGSFVNATETALTIDSGGSLLLNDPRNVVLYAGNRRPVLWQGSRGTFSASAQQVNHWSTSTPWGVAGTFSDFPTGRWQKNDKDQLFTFSGTVAAGASDFTELTSNYDPLDTQGSAFDMVTFSVRGARAISIGRLDLSAEYRYDTGDVAQLFGGTASSAAVRASFPHEGETVFLNDTLADEWGDYSFQVERNSIPPGVEITVESNWHFLFQEDITSTEPAGLGFYRRPEDLAFETIPLSGQAVLAMRRDPDWGLAVRDTRENGGSWRLTAQVLEPLTPAGAEGRPIVNAIALVWEGENHQIIPQNSPILIYEHRGAPGPDPVVISWESGEGILAIIQPGAALADVPYAGTIRWILEDAP